ncbi:hypothetical protein IMCC3317_45320 [Kordia antarctica]|uniref:Transposase n=1 Tax=Kordia antarctica TaxID=1218801 RepID=A0A7L4ZRI2_9FLAO|nr:hypothetical protein [Kordia antarctica]QHI39131.1 hypothetical protein IMCC3317_45320 [Kordia antarctica]
MKKNPFKEMRIQKDLPPEIKKKVLNDIASITLATELTDLFTVKFATIFQDLLGKSKK